MTSADRVQRAGPVIFGRGAPEKTQMAEHIKNVDGHPPEKALMAAGDCAPDTTTKAIFGGLSMELGYWRPLSPIVRL